jgi:hypothetical protein
VLLAYDIVFRTYRPPAPVGEDGIGTPFEDGSIQ